MPDSKTVGAVCRVSHHSGIACFPTVNSVPSDDIIHFPFPFFLALRKYYYNCNICGEQERSKWKIQIANKAMYLRGNWFAVESKSSEHLFLFLLHMVQQSIEMYEQKLISLWMRIRQVNKKILVYCAWNFLCLYLSLVNALDFLMYLLHTWIFEDPMKWKSELSTQFILIKEVGDRISAGIHGWVPALHS